MLKVYQILAQCIELLSSTKAKTEEYSNISDIHLHHLKGILQKVTKNSHAISVISRKLEGVDQKVSKLTEVSWMLIELLFIMNCRYIDYRTNIRTT